MSTNTWNPDQSQLATDYARHTTTLRGVLRHELVSRALHHHLDPAPQQVLDIGGGNAHQAITLARAGHHVTMLDPDAAMLTRARAALDNQPRPVASRVRLVEGHGEDTAQLVGTGWDAACCHGVLMYLDDPSTMLTTLATAARPGGLISVLTKNAHALAMRPALQQQWHRAQDLLTSGATAETGSLGVTSRAHTPNGLAHTLATAGADTLTWYGVRVFTDHLGDQPVGEDLTAILDLEWTAGSRDPYRRLARLFHLIARRRPQ